MADPPDVQLSAAEQHLLSVMDGQLADDELAMVCGMSRQQLQRTVARMVSLGVATLEPVPSVKPKSVSPVASAVQLPESSLPLIDELFAALDRTDHYTLLGIGHQADKNDVKRAYYRMAPAFHPDKHYGKELGPFKGKIEAIFTRLTRAHDTLRYKRRRLEYDESLGERHGDRVRLTPVLSTGGMSASAAAESILGALRTVVPAASSLPRDSIAPPSSPRRRLSQQAIAAVSGATASQGRASQPGAEQQTLRSPDSGPRSATASGSRPATAATDRHSLQPGAPVGHARRISTAAIARISDPGATPRSEPGMAGTSARLTQPPDPRSSWPAEARLSHPERASQPARLSQPEAASSPGPPSQPSRLTPPDTQRSAARAAAQPAPPLDADETQRRREALRRRLGVRERVVSSNSPHPYPALPKEIPRSVTEVLRDNFEEAARHGRRKRFDRYLNMGRRAMEGGDYRAAEAAFTQALKIDPADSEAAALAKKAALLAAG